MHSAGGSTIGRRRVEFYRPLTALAFSMPPPRPPSMTVLPSNAAHDRRTVGRSKGSLVVGNERFCPCCTFSAACPAPSCYPPPFPPSIHPCSLQTVSLRSASCCFLGSQSRMLLFLISLSLSLSLSLSFRPSPPLVSRPSIAVYWGRARYA
ncbi:hypothetical protein BD413DRAFT_142382 [Trametes elegans]|nr:hypothetical protein BD413DRAFT_142382 [Trametes elegans]